MEVNVSQTIANRDPEVQAMLDREAIGALVRRYGYLAWRSDQKGQAALFTPDATFSAQGAPNVLHGPAEIEKSFAARDAQVGPRPTFHNHVIELRGDGTGSGAVCAEIRSAKNGMKLMVLAIYEDEYVKVGSEWKFRSRKVTSFPAE